MRNNGRNKAAKSKIIRTLGDQKKYKNIGFLEKDTIKQEDTKEKNRKEYFRWTRKLPETELYSKNLVKGMNIRIVPFVRYSGPFLKWTRENLFFFSV